jgi:hypothetical protein
MDIAKSRILEILGTRFLTYWSASPVAPLRDALMKNDGVYRIGFLLLGSPSEKRELEGVTQERIHYSVTHPNPPFSGRGLEQIIFEYSTARS